MRLILDSLCWRIGYIGGWLSARMLYSHFSPGFVKEAWSREFKRRFLGKSQSDKNVLRDELESNIALMAEVITEHMIVHGKTDEEILKDCDDALAQPYFKISLEPFLTTGLLSVERVRAICEEQLFLARHRRNHGRESTTTA